MVAAFHQIFYQNFPENGESKLPDIYNRMTETWHTTSLLENLQKHSQLLQKKIFA